jgi:phenylalanyl-tRNA synthetase alpha chain
VTTTDTPAAAQLDELVRDGRAAIAAAADLDALDRAVGSLFGKRGALTAIKRGLGRLDEGGRRALGRRVNDAYADLEPLIARRRADLEDERDREVLVREAVDVTLPARTPRRGRLHPIPETMEAMVDAFVGLGYSPVPGPEVESDYFNFTALNFAQDHPARFEHDTIYVRPLLGDAAQHSTLLRTHTSPVQVRTMLAGPPPVFVVVPGRVYRQDTPDATHLPVFHQVEGLAVDTDLSFADLRGTLAAFARALLGAEVRTRFRPHYFPFTEPSCELDAWIGGRWVELLGAGMVHPNVLRMAGYDPEQVSGFAFGIGVERVAMLRYGITDLRLLAENDLRLLEF